LTGSLRPSGRLRRLAALSVAAFAGSSLIAAAAAAAAPAWPGDHHPANGAARPVDKAYTEAGGAKIRYAVNRPLCARPAHRNDYSCYAIERQTVAKGTRGAYRYVTPDGLTTGPHGGYTPADLATAYHFNPDRSRSGQTIALVDWFDDPDAKADLNTFDQEYGLPAETSSTFRKVNEDGHTAPLPSPSTDTSGEIALDVEAARAVCHTCKILLVEANKPTDTHLATAEDTAAGLGATEISNSFGAPEHHLSRRNFEAFDQPGIVVTASTGDDGWFGWDFANRPSGSSQNAAPFPAVSPTVVAVGGTALYLNPDASRLEEDVWDENGLENTGLLTGATGGGCSTLYHSADWQRNYPGYKGAHCHAGRLAADVSAIGDPQTGFDVIDSFGQGGWFTVGGTSLSSPVIAAMYALAGGSGGSAYPAASLYVNAAHNPSARNDVLAPSGAVAGAAGGNGFCGGASNLNCGNYVFAHFGGTTHNPNALGPGEVDCSFPRDNSDPPVAPPFDRECNAAAGFDGPSGLGTPKGLGLFAPTNPRVSVTKPAHARTGHPALFHAHVTEHISDLHPTDYFWVWGDGKNSAVSSHTTSLAEHHTYAHGGTYSGGLVFEDSSGQEVIKLFRLHVHKH
jgi:hypothetical protein